MRPLLSVIIPTYHREWELVRTIESVYEQVFTDYELIVVDQSKHHDPATVRYLKNQRLHRSLKVLREPVASLPRARNVGVANASGEVILFLDDDVILPPLFLQRYANRFNDPELDACCGMILPEGYDPSRVPHLPENLDNPENRIDLPICNYATPVENPIHFTGGNMAVRRDTFLLAGGFNHRFTQSALGEDIEFAGRLRRMAAKTDYDPGLFLWHCPAKTGGCRLTNSRSFHRQADRMQSLYFAIFHGPDFWLGTALAFRRWKRWLLAAAGKRTVSPLNQAILDTPVRRNRLAEFSGGLLGGAKGFLLALSTSGEYGHYHKVFPSRQRPRKHRIAIVIATYNRQPSLINTLQSLKETGNLPKDLIIVDQSDDPLPPTEGMSISLSRRGASLARNIGVMETRADVVLFLDDDIEALPNLINQHRAIHRNRVVAAGGRIAWDRQQAVTSFPYPYSQFSAINHPDAPVCYYTTPFSDAFHLITCNFSAKRDALLLAGGFLQWFRGGGEDIELLSRLRKIGRCSYIPNACVIHKLDPSGGTRDTSSVYIRAYRKHLAFHVSNLRSVGILGWIGVLGRRYQRLLLSGRSNTKTHPAMPVRKGATSSPYRAFTRYAVKILELAGEVAAIPQAFYTVWQLRNRRGDYFQEWKQWRKK